MKWAVAILLTFLATCPSMAQPACVIAGSIPCLPAGTNPQSTDQVYGVTTGQGGGAGGIGVHFSLSQLGGGGGGPFLPLAGGTLSGSLIWSLGGNDTSEMFPTTGDPWVNTNSLELGGITANNPGFLYVRGQPIGFYDLGAGFSIVNSNDVLGNHRAGINGGWEHGVSAVASYGYLDTVGQYTGMVNSSAPLIVSGVTYDATHILFSPSLSVSQISLLRDNMYVMTNSIDGTVSTTPAQPNGLKPTNLYASTVSGWASDGSSITVRGWTVPGSGHTTAGQVPSSTYDASAGYSTATVFLGQTTNLFDWNSRIDLTATGGSSSYIHSANGWELDLTNNPAQADFSNRFCGICIHFDPQLHYPTSDSKIININASAMPTGLFMTLDTYPGNPINGSDNPTYIDAGALALFAGPSPAPPLNSSNVILDLTGYVDTNRYRAMLWTNRYHTGGIGGWTENSMNFGVQIDGSRGELDGQQSGTVVFGPSGFAQGIGLQTNGGLGLAVASNGNPYIGTVGSTAIHIGNSGSTTTVAGTLNATLPSTAISGSDRSSAVDPTIATTDMGSQINLTNSTPLTVVLPALATGLWQPGQSMILASQGAGAVTLTNSTTLTAAGSCASIGPGNSVLIAANNDGTHLDCQALVGAGGVIHPTAFSNGTATSGTTTIDCGNGPIQTLINGGVFTLAMSANDGQCIVRVTNNGSAGTITFSGFSQGSNSGDSLTTTNTNKFDVSLTRIGGSPHYLISALQ